MRGWDRAAGVGRAPLRRWGWELALAFFAEAYLFGSTTHGHDWDTFRFMLSDQGDTWGPRRRDLRSLRYDLAPRLVSATRRGRAELARDMVATDRIQGRAGRAVGLRVASRKKTERACRPQAAGGSRW